MNTTDFQSSDVSPLKQIGQNYYLQFQKSASKLSTQELHLLEKKMKYLALQFDPYTQEGDEACEVILNQLHLHHFTGDPFAFTNLLLQMIDFIENAIHENTVSQNPSAQ